MSNIHSPVAHHGLDDEPNADGTMRCLVCWSKAKTKFFAAKYHRRGETLFKLYATIHDEEHQ